MKQFNHSVVGGTFDHFHQGHQKLLSTAISHSQKLTIGLTTPPMLKSKDFATSIQSYRVRRRQLTNYLRGKIPFTIAPLKNPFGPAATSTKYDAIFATLQTEANVNKLNALRIKNHLPLLKKIIVPPVIVHSSLWLSSELIRQGLVNSKGVYFPTLFSKTLKLPTKHRSLLQSPFHKLHSGHPDKIHLAAKKVQKLIAKHHPLIVISVGDIATLSLTRQKITPDLAVFDLKTQRQARFDSPLALGLSTSPDYSLVNPAGTITPNLVKTILLAIKNHRQTIFVKGEEDLAVLPAVLLSPLGSAVVYGQPQQGLVYIPVNPNTKAKALMLIRKFT